VIHVMHCREVATLLDSDAVPRLNLVNRVQVRIHLWVCWHCRLLVKQIAWLRVSAQSRLHTAPASDPGPDFEQKLLKRLLF
jgi:hypothetical protein